MDEALILKKLDALSNEIHTLKAEIIAELKKDMLPMPAGPLVEDCLSDLDQEQRREDLAHFLRNLVLNVETLNSLLGTAKGAMELKDEIEPIAKQTLPRIIDFFAEMEEQIDIEELAVLARNTLSSIQHFNTALTMLKAGMELKDEIEPIAKLVLPKAIGVFAELEEQIDLDEMVNLLRNSLGNIQHFNTAINMLKAGMELKDEIEPIAKLTLPNIIKFYGDMEGVLSVAGTAMTAMKGCNCTPAQAEAMSAVIRSIDLSRSNKIGPVGAVKKLYDPKVQEALGVIFTLLEAFGSLLQAHRDNR